MAEYKTVDVFTDNPFGGNPLAVFPDAREIAEADLQKVAREFNYSETTFVFPPNDPAHTARVRIFTPTDEIPFAGHPNVGTAFVLGRLGEIFGRPVGTQMIFEEKAGIVHLDLMREGGRVVGAGFVAPQALTIDDEVARDAMSACLTIQPEAIVAEAHEPCIVSVGLPFAVAELASLDALAAVRPDMAAFTSAERAYRHRDDRFATFAYVRTGAGIANLRARMFAPLSNVLEDPATGSASAALAAYLCTLDTRPNMTASIIIEQGVEMGRPSKIEIDVEKRGGVVERVRIAGRCVPVMHGRLEIVAR